MKALLAAVIAIGMALSVSVGAMAGGPPEEVVERVIDGDTVVMESGERIRLRIIDAPEISHPRCEREREEGERAKTFLRGMVEGRAVLLHREGRDRYGRTLAYMTVDERDVGTLMIGHGYARVWNPHHKIDWCALLDERE